MALELTSLVFKTETSDLERASKVIGELVTNVGKLDKAARDAAQTEATLARAAKDSAKANLDNAKAQDTRLKSTITADKADQQATAAIERKTKATERASVAIKKNADMLQLQNDTYDFILEGFSKGDAKVLAMAKATGQLSDQLKQVLTDIRQFSKNTFDQTETGLDRMVKSAKEASSAQGFLNNGLNLTSKQAKELSNDLDRLNIRLQHQGKSYQEITKEQAIYKQRFVEEANAVNRATSALAAVEKQRKDVVSATNYLTQAEAKMAAALNTSNAALDKAGTDSLVKYESALRKSGVSQDVATQKLATYKAQLAQVAAVEEKRRAQHLTRALTPQISDVAVSLWSGQSPLTVLLQQGSQINDMFQLSGVAAADFGKTVKEAFSSMLPSIRTVVKGVGGLLVDGFMAAGGAVLGFAGRVTGMTGAVDAASKKLMDMGWTTAAAGAKAFGAAMTGTFASGVAVAVAVLISLGIAFKNAIKEGGELTRNLELTGASLALTKSAALELAQSLASSERPVANVVNVINELAKAGKFSSENIALVTNAAIDLERYGKVSIAETAKELSKLREDPVKALLEVAEKTGYVNVETIETVKSLREQGKMAEAAELAMKAWATSSTSAATSIKNQMSPLEQVWDSILSKINQVIGKLQDVARGSGTAEQIANKEAQLASVRGGFFTSTFGLSPKGAKDVDRLTEEIYMLKLQLQAETDITNERAKRSSAAAQLKAEAEATKEYTTALEKQASKELTLSEFVKKAVEERTKVVASALGKNVEDVKLSAEAISKITSGAELQWQEMQKTTSSPSENYYATLMREATASSIKAEDATKSLTASQVKLLEAVNDPRFLKLSKVQQETYLSTMAANVATEQQTALTEKLAEAEEHRLKLLGKSEGIGKQYYSDMQKLEKFAKVAGWSRSEVEELTRAVFMATPAWKAYEKSLEEVNSAARKFKEDSLASQAATRKENESLDYRLSLLGKTAEEQKALSIEYNRANKISEVRIKLAKQLRDIEADIEKAKKAGLPEEKYKNLIDAQVQARKDAAEQEKAINREVAVQAAEDYDAEFKKIKSTISESITAALFDGGKAGSSKIKDYLKATLRERFTLSVDAFINPIMGTVAGALSPISNGSSALNGGISTGISNAFSKFAGSSVGQSLGLSNSTAIVGNNPSAYVPEGGQLTSLGQSIGTAAGMIGSGLTGYGISSAISGGYTTGGNTVNVLAGVASAFYGPIAGVIGGLVNRAFGRKLADSGIQGSFGTQEGFSGESYQFYKGGWFRSDKTKTSEMDASLAKALDTAFTQMITQVGTLGTVLGLNTDKLKDFNTTFKISFQGLQEEEIQGKIQEALATANNEMAEQILGTWSKTTKEVTYVIETSVSGEGSYFENITRVVEEVSYTASSFAREGEKAIDTLTRLATSITLVNSTFEGLGYSLYEASLQGGDFASKLIDFFGGNDNFAALTTSYYENFYSEQEKTALLTKQLTKEFGKFNEAIPTTKAEFKAIVDKQDLLTDSGRESFAKLLGLQTPLLSLFDLLEKAAADTAESVKELSSSVIDEINRLRGYTDTSGNSPQALIAEFDRLTTLARGGDANAFNSLGETSKLLDEYYKNTATSAVQYAYQRSVLANSLEQSYNTAKAGGATFSGTSSLMGTPTLSTPVVSSVSSANAAGSSGLATLLSDLITEVSMLRAEVRADVVHNAKTAKILERVTPEGDALATRNEG